MSTQTAPKPDVLDLLAEREQARLSFASFLRHVRIEEPGTGPVAFEMWPHLKELTDDLMEHQFLVRLKSKQIGYSWWLASLGVWIGQFTPAGLMLLFSAGERESHELLRKTAVVHRLLPPHLQVPLAVPPNMEALRFVGGGRVQAFPSTPSAGIGETATVAAIDEADFHPHFEQNLFNIKPTTDAGGKLIIGSTANSETIVSPFKTLYRNAPGNHYHPRFLSWRVRPGRTDAWHKKTLEGSLDPAKELKNYPNTAEEALAAPQSQRAFDTEALDAMRADPRKPIAVNGPVTVWQKKIVGRRYCAFTDTSHGVGADFAVTGIMDVENERIVADVFSNALSPEDLAALSVTLLKEYDSPIWGIEDNDWGHEVISKAKALGYTNLYHRDNDAKKPEGWHTDDRTRPVLWGELQEAVKAGHVQVWNENGLAQFYDVIKTAPKDGNPGGRIEAISGGHDDYPFMVGGCLQMRKHAYGGTSGKVVVVASRWGQRS